MLHNGVNRLKYTSRMPTPYVCVCVCVCVCPGGGGGTRCSRKKTGEKGYPNRCDQKSSHAIIRGKGRYRGGGYFHNVCILGMCRKRDPHFQPWISVPEHVIFTNYPHPHSQNVFNFNPFIASHGRSSARSEARSGDPHFHARPGARSGALAIFSLCRGTYLPKFGVSKGGGG